ncbi:glycoside hydrolase family 68 protein [Pontibacillus halophilus]|uniref:glycoside hydrolase family 68 protein n=1 Tax=Pontibacillus halophilus TaxID=516704 RepID=UPI001E4089F5|nr:glycoside hydrolase family 68 protein [Pontibacillus halophilus]
MNTRKAKTLSMATMTAAVMAGVVYENPLHNENVHADADVVTAEWTREDAQNFERTDENTPSNIDSFTDVAPDLWVWDTWPLRNRDGSLAEINGYKVVFALTASKDYTWGGRHDEAEIRYFYSKDGKNWEIGGLPYDPEKAFGSRQWAGSAMLEEDGTVNLFYTASGRNGEEPVYTTTNEFGEEVTVDTHLEQRLAKTTFSFTTDEEGVEAHPTGEHKILAEADGEMYQTQEQNQGEILYSFRDPWFFQDPESGEEYIVFEGNTAGQMQPSENPDVPENAKHFNGNVGIAKATDDSLDNFELQEPLLHADYTNQQLERPHIVYQDGNYHLFTITHEFTFADGIKGPDGVYGFVNEELRGDYEPMNDTGLVVANPEEDPFQAYSWAVLPNLNVISFVNEFHDENGNFQTGGSFAPTLQLEMDGTESKIVGELAEGEIEYPENEDKDETPKWTSEQAQKFERTAKNTMEEINLDNLDQLDENAQTWDTWPLRNKDGSIAEVDGYQVIFALSAPNDVLPGKRHDIAEIKYYISKDGENWEEGGKLFPEGEALGSRQWAGSAMIDEDGKLHAFYTATGRQGEKQLTYEQRLAKASADVEITEDGIQFSEWSDHDVILEPEGKYYQTKEESEQGDIAYAFRDPWFFQDPATGEEYILFEGNTNGTPAERAKENFVEQSESTLFNGNIGIAKATNDELTEYEIQAPLLEAPNMNQELERPHIVMKDDKYYLFTDTHTDKFAPGIDAEDGLYGFVADSLKGDYEPLNESGLVLTNPESNPYQAYSWMVMPEGTVVSFANFSDLDGIGIPEIGQQSEEFQFEHFGGTLAPSVQLSIEGDETEVVETLDQGVLAPEQEGGVANSNAAAQANSTGNGSASSAVETTTEDGEATSGAGAQAATVGNGTAAGQASSEGNAEEGTTTSNAAATAATAGNGNAASQADSEASTDETDADNHAEAQATSGENGQATGNASSQTTTEDGETSSNTVAQSSTTGNGTAMSSASSNGTTVTSMASSSGNGSASATSTATSDLVDNPFEDLFSDSFGLSFSTSMSTSTSFSSAFHNPMNNSVSAMSNSFSNSFSMMSAMQ